MQSFSFTQANGAPKTVQGYRYAPPRAGSRRFVAAGPRTPRQVDLRPFLTPVEDQSATNSCAANAVAGAVEYLIKRAHGDESYDVSRLFIYYNGRAADGEEIEDEGCVLQSAIAGLEESGACSEETWPFDEENVNEPPDDDAFAEAESFSIEGAEQVPTNLNAWRAALADGHPIIFGLKLFGSFDKHRKPGLVPMPTPSDLGREGHGGHAMLCVGYSDVDEVFIVRNSWGEEWGDQGYCYLPYRYVMNPDYNFDDSWIIRSVDVTEPDESTWSDDDESLLTAIGDAIAGLDEEGHAALLERLGEVPVDVRVGLLFLAAAGADGALEDEEIAEGAAQLSEILTALGSRQDPEDVLASAAETYASDDGDALIEDTIEAFGELFPAEVLASLIEQLQLVAEGDGEANDDEQAFIDALTEAWQVADDEE
jgi:hypothetical protein